MRNFYLVFPTKTDSIENLLITKLDCIKFWKEIEMTLIRIDCEANTQLFCTQENKNEFIDEIESLGNLLQIGHYEKEDIFNLWIYEYDIKFKDHREDIIYKEWITKNEQTTDAPDYLKGITENSFINPNQKFEILHFSEQINESNLRIIRDDKISCPKFFCFDVYKGFRGIDENFTKINESRVLNTNDFRHCENHTDYISGKDPLIGGINGFDNAKNFLSSAIGDCKTGKKILVNIDTNNKSFFIRFEDENFNNQFHTFHLVKNEEGNYIEDFEGVKLSRSKNKGISRAFDLLEYRNNI
ncbi:hypothetical protein [uncultured Chryseobacterium sp.]|uniref:hypothetical protein n=1 Tax=uncultured Chryseobacterium sp. TaxID=259322 RepID=UPI0025FDAD25|nr:hypothetical protein [uncultured Chryseobacterium sp.]